MNTTPTSTTTGHWIGRAGRMIAGATVALGMTASLASFMPAAPPPTPTTTAGKSDIRIWIGPVYRCTKDFSVCWVAR